jgi:hypothetical protein
MLGSALDFDPASMMRVGQTGGTMGRTATALVGFAGWFVLLTIVLVV